MAIAIVPETALRDPPLWAKKKPVGPVRLSEEFFVLATGNVCAYLLLGDVVRELVTNTAQPDTIGTVTTKAGGGKGRKYTSGSSARSLTVRPGSAPDEFTAWAVITMDGGYWSNAWTCITVANNDYPHCGAGFGVTKVEGGDPYIRFALFYGGWGSFYGSTPFGSIHDQKTYVIGATKPRGGAGTTVFCMTNTGVYEEITPAGIYQIAGGSVISNSAWVGDESIQPVLHMSAMVFKSVSLARLQNIVNDPYQFLVPA